MRCYFVRLYNVVSRNRLLNICPADDNPENIQPLLITKKRLGRICIIAALQPQRQPFSLGKRIAFFRVLLASGEADVTGMA